MPGILCNSASVVMTDPATTKSGFVTGEQVVLTVSPTATTHAWALSKPRGSGSTCQLSDETYSAPTFTPDVSGVYAVVCTVNGTTTYTIRMSVAATSAVALAGTLHLMPQAAEGVATPTLGRNLYYDPATGTLRVKDPTGTTSELTDASALTLSTYPPKSNATIDTPPAGARVFYSTELGSLAKKTSNGIVWAPPKQGESPWRL